MDENLPHQRVVIERVRPQVDYGLFPIKRTAGERVVVEADVYADGHDLVSANLLYRVGNSEWDRVPMKHIGNDRWRAEFNVAHPGRYYYTVQAWIDRFGSWRENLGKKAAACEEVTTDLQLGAALIEETYERCTDQDAKKLRELAEVLRQDEDPTRKLRTASSEQLSELMERYPDKQNAVTYDKEFEVIVDRERARFSSWYELFPRSCAPKKGTHGTFRDCEKRLAYVAEMGFDVAYLPPIHPIGRTHKKGRNGSLTARPSDPGSPWSIGSEAGGHKSVHPNLGTLEDFDRLMNTAKEYGIEIALDLAFHCSPDHPYVKEHPEWFRWRPDGSVQYAENPPKKYQDIYPLNFETERWKELWEELKSIILFWVEHGVRIFRVDNPHTKPFHFWKWLINEVKKDLPEIIFLSEAFTRPKVMYQLAKLGFTQSYTYFAWRNTKSELTGYFEELTRTDVLEYFRANLWPNTPDILTEYLQSGGRPAFLARLVLAATLGANYGIYGPAFELLENQAREPGSEEYLYSEKYEIKYWNLESPKSLRGIISRVNRIRRDHPALQSDTSLVFHHVDNDQLICYSKQTRDVSNVIVVVVNLDPHWKQSGWVELPLETMGINPSQPYQMHDLLTETRYLWQGPRNYVELDPTILPAHIFRIRHRVRTERDFDYYT